MIFFEYTPKYLVYQYAIEKKRKMVTFRKYGELGDLSKKNNKICKLKYFYIVTK